MKTMTIAAAALLTASGFALAGEDESAFTIDLSAASKDTHTYHVKCQYGGKDPRYCGSMTLWENTNGVKGLQTTTSMTGTPPDVRVLS